MENVNRKISVEFLENKGFIEKRIFDRVFYVKNIVAITFDTRVNVWVLCLIINNEIRYMSPPLYIEYEDELMKYYHICTGKML